MSFDKVNAAIRTLENLGYTYLEGAKLWKPPLGPDPSPLLEACAQVADRAKIKQDELYQVCRADPTMTETARESSLDRIAAKSRMAEQIAKSIRALKGEQ